MSPSVTTPSFRRLEKVEISSRIFISFGNFHALKFDSFLTVSIHSSDVAKNIVELIIKMIINQIQVQSYKVPMFQSMVDLMIKLVVNLINQLL